MQEELRKMLEQFANKIVEVVETGNTDPTRFQSAAQDVTDRIGELIALRINERFPE